MKITCFDLMANSDLIEFDMTELRTQEYNGTDQCAVTIQFVPNDIKYPVCIILSTGLVDVDIINDESIYQASLLNILADVVYRHTT